jgi:serine/threonine protein kinase
MTNGQIVNGYLFSRRLGSGASGEVWQARHTQTGTEKAIRILSDEADSPAGQRDIQALDRIKALRHPQLLATEDYWVLHGRVYVVMELADGTLRTRLKQCLASGLPGIPQPELLAAMTEAAGAIDYLHSQQVLHRNVKPDNVLLVGGHARVADFGFSRQHGQVMANMSAFLGSPAYMAPEVWSGEYGPASDRYSFAVTYLEMRQGRLPVKPGAVMDIMFGHLESKFDFAPMVGEAERAACRRALAKTPADRYATCAEFVKALG